MMHKILIFIFTALISTSALAREPFKIMLEGGAVWQHRNDVQIPPTTGTLVEFDNYNKGPFTHYRGEFFINFNDKHGIRLVYAPFQVSVKGRPESAIDYNGQTFNTTEDLTVNYKFNSYRLSYVYQLIDEKDRSLAIGITGKVRDAKIEFVQGATSTAYDNVGFVPLFYAAGSTEIGTDWYLFSDVDAAAASQGRAIDFTLKLRYRLTGDSALGLGYRTLEGGADNDKVVTWSWFNYAVLDYVAEF